MLELYRFRELRIVMPFQVMVSISDIKLFSVGALNNGANQFKHWSSLWSHL